MTAITYHVSQPAVAAEYRRRGASFASEFVSFSRNRANEFVTRHDRFDRRLVLAEYLLLHLYMLDRIALDALGEEPRLPFIEGLVDGTVSAVATADADRGVLREVFWGKLNIRCTEYSKRSLVLLPNEKGGYSFDTGVAWKFSELIGASGDPEIVMIGQLEMSQDYVYFHENQRLRSLLSTRSGTSSVDVKQANARQQELTTTSAVESRRQGPPPGIIERIRENGTTAPQKELQPRRDPLLSHESKRALLGLLMILVVFGGGNLVLVGAQKLWHRGDQTRLDELRRKLAFESAVIEAEKTAILSMVSEADQLQTEISSIRAELDQIENANPQGIPEMIYASYSASVDQHNAAARRLNDLSASVKARETMYEEKIDLYNAEVHEANALSKKIGGTWILIPVPRIGRHSSTH